MGHLRDFQSRNSSRLIGQLRETPLTDTGLEPVQLKYISNLGIQKECQVLSAWVSIGKHWMSRLYVH